MSSSSTSFFSILLLLLVLLLGSNSTIAKTFKTLMLPLKKDDTTLQYYTSFAFGTPRISVNTVIDLAGDSLWLSCTEAGYNSTSYRNVRCGSNSCNLSGSGCIGSKCYHMAYNPYLNMLIEDELAEDVLFGYSSDGATYVSHVTVPKFPFSCVESILLGRLANETRGMIGLSRNRLALPSMFRENFKVPSKFAICAPSLSGSGEIFVGGGPYYILPYPKDMSKMLIKTPLLVNPVSTSPIWIKNNSMSDEYYINVTSIRIDRKYVRFDSSKLTSFRKDGVGGTKISTITPYTTLRSSIYKAILRDFVVRAKSWKMKRVKTVRPFGACYDSKTVSYTRTGPAVPVIDLVLQKSNVYWSIYGANSMVKVSKNVMCLGFVDGGLNPKTPIVIGGHQLEDNLLEFDLDSSKLGFSSTLLLYNTSCSHDSIENNY